MFEIHELDLIALREDNVEWQKFIDHVPCAMARFIFDKTFTVICANDAFYEQSGHTRREFETSINYHCSRIIHPDDLSALTETIQEQLKSGKHIETDYRIQKKDGSTEWCHIKGIQVEEFNGFPIFDATFSIVTKAIEDAQNAEKYKKDAFALMNSIPGGIAKRSAEPYGSYWDFSDGFFELTGYSRTDYVAMTQEQLSKLIHPDNQDVLNEISKQVLHKLPIDVDYRILCKDGSTRRITQIGTLITPQTEEPYYQCVFTGIMDSRTAEQAYKTEKAKYDTLMNSLNCGLAQYSTDGKLIYFNDRFCEMTGYTREGIIKSAICEGHVLIFEEDRNRVIQETKQQLESEGKISTTFRSIHSDGKISWIRAQSHMVEDMEGNPIIQILFTDISDKKQVEQALGKSEGKLKQLIDTIPGGICDIRFDGSKIIPGSFSDGVYRIIGYSKEEYFQLPQRLNDRLRIALESDVQAAIQDIREQAGRGIFISTSFRIQKKDGSIIWLALQGRIIKQEGNISTIQCICTDITAIKSDASAAETELARYHILSALTNSILFEYESDSDTLNCYGDVASLFDIAPVTLNYKANAIKSGLFYEGDLTAFISLCERLSQGEKHCSQRIRIKQRDGEYLWHEISCSPVFNKNNKVTKVIGKVRNIEEEIRQLELFPNNSDQDALTGLHSNSSGKTLIQNYLNTNPKETGLLMLMNLNDFKIVNETLGEAAGDVLLKDVATMLQTSFRNADILTRVGGDEFMIFMKDIPDHTSPEEKETQLLTALKGLRAGENKDFPISGSVGYSIYPKDGKNFDELFDKADFSLYRAKRYEKTRAEIS